MSTRIPIARSPCIAFIATLFQVTPVSWPKSDGSLSKFGAALGHKCTPAQCVIDKIAASRAWFADDFLWRFAESSAMLITREHCA